ncbi:MAG TPA: hypothetical protein PKE45_14820, partial [Caldilineaceae bacterium]|nr:hypothetical protein [Caldilineaceae bacterium]
MGATVRVSGSPTPASISPMTAIPFTIRSATEADRTAILGLMRPRDYNRIHLKTECFVVAEEAGRVIGIGQIKRHWEG